MPDHAPRSAGGVVGMCLEKITLSIKHEFVLKLNK